MDNYYFVSKGICIHIVKKNIKLNQYYLITFNILSYCTSKKKEKKKERNVSGVSNKKIHYVLKELI